MDIGKPEREYVAEPLEEPVPKEIEVEPARVEEAPEREEIPA